MIALLPYFEVLHGDCREVLGAMSPLYFDAIVTDPPYGLSFMGKGWDHAVPGVEFWREILRVAKPGAWMVAFGGTRKWHRLAVAVEDAGWEIRDTISWLYGQGFPKTKSALKPAFEPILLCRAPGPMRMLGIDACRIAFVGDDTTASARSAGRGAGRATANVDGPAYGKGLGGVVAPPHDLGRWPANVVLDEEAAALLDEQSGVLTSGTGAVMKASAKGYAPNALGKESRPAGTKMIEYGDSGGASRFFYCAKASRSERTHGGRVENKHPTVKPVALMRWLARLVTPPGGFVLDPFCGSGTTLVACVEEGFDVIGIDSDASSVTTARARAELARPS